MNFIEIKIFRANIYETSNTDNDVMDHLMKGNNIFGFYWI